MLYSIDMDEEFELTADDLQEINTRKFNISCCRSYLTTRGRCFSCPEQNLDEEDTEE